MRPTFENSKPDPRAAKMWKTSTYAWLHTTPTWARGFCPRRKNAVPTNSANEFLPTLYRHIFAESVPKGGKGLLHRLSKARRLLLPLCIAVLVS